MISLNKLGMIKGGDCERRFKARRGREKGAKLAVEWLLHHNCIEIKKGWCKVVSVPKKLYTLRWPIDYICKEHGHIGSGDVEIGWRRFMSDIVLPLCKGGMKFRLSKLETWGADKAAEAFMVEFAARRLLNKSMVGLKDGIPQQDELYKEWLKERSL